MAVNKFAVVLQKDRNFDREMRRLKATPEAIADAVKKELLSTAVFIRNRIIKSMRRTPKTGRRYRKTKNKNVFHIASSPGYAPAVDTGDLLKSIKMDVRLSEVEVGSNLSGKNGKYPAFLEFGTRKMDARPWLKPAVDDGKREFQSTIRRRVINAIHRAR